MNLFMIISPKTVCTFFGHKWSDEDHRPCEKFKTCKRCRTEDVQRGWHAFSNWTAPYGVNVLEEHGGKAVQVNQDRQRRTCKDCQWVDERVVLG